MARERSGDRRGSSVQDADWEVLPPEQQRDARAAEPLFRWIALLMDNFIRVPGTQFRFGIDPLLGLIPGLGDTGSAMVSAMALILAARTGVPKIVLARMSLNILLNELIGVVPVLGDVFSFWFKSNARNYEILKQHMSSGAAARKSRRSDWVFVIGVLVVLALIVCAGILISLLVVQQLIRLVSGR